MVSRRSVDVFLSHSNQDAGIAEAVVRALTDAGLTVVRPQDFAFGNDFTSTFRAALVESRAVVVLVTPSSVRSANLAFEIGAAMAWQKPIFLLTDGVEPSALPSVARLYRAFAASDLEKLIEPLKEASPELRERERELLKRIYQESRLPIDLLLSDPESLDRFSRKFNDRARTSIPGERLAAELLRLRKTGQVRRAPKRLPKASVVQ